MAMTCNIDGKGRIARLISGVIVLVAGIVLAAAWAWPGGWWVAWLIAALTIGSGMFQIFEAWKGWCIMRAMGFRTPM